MKLDKGKINTIISDTKELWNLINNGEYISKEDYLNYIGNILCQFDTDIAIKVLENEDFGEVGKLEALSIKINYGY